MGVKLQPFAYQTGVFIQYCSNDKDEPISVKERDPRQSLHREVPEASQKRRTSVVVHDGLALKPLCASFVEVARPAGTRISQGWLWLEAQPLSQSQRRLFPLPQCFPCRSSARCSCSSWTTSWPPLATCWLLIEWPRLEISSRTCAGGGKTVARLAVRKMVMAR